MPTQDVLLSINRDVLVAYVGTEAILLSQQDGLYYGLNEVATRVWRLCEQGVSLQQIGVALGNEYDVDALRVRHDVDRLVDEWISAGLVMRRPDENSGCRSETS